MTWIFWVPIRDQLAGLRRLAPHQPVLPFLSAKPGSFLQHLLWLELSSAGAKPLEEAKV